MDISFCKQPGVATRFYALKLYIYLFIVNLIAVLACLRWLRHLPGEASMTIPFVYAVAVVLFALAVWARAAVND